MGFWMKINLVSKSAYIVKLDNLLQRLPSDWNVILDKKGFEMSLVYKYIHDDDYITKHCFLKQETDGMLDC